jgi:putative ABC transport system permease protein
MVSIARRNLFQEKTRFIISITGVAVAIMLILFLSGIFQGFLVLYKSYVLNSGADIWVASDGWRDFHSISMLPRDIISDIKKIDGVRKVDYIILIQSAAFKSGDDEIAAVLVGFNPETGLGGPWKIYKGTADIGQGEVIIDRYLAYKYGLDIGDEIEISSEKLIIAGISEETNLVIYQMIFLREDDASRILNLDGIVTFILVNADNPSEVTKKINEEIPGVAAYTSEEYVEKGFAFMESFNPFLYITAVAGSIVGIAIIGITIYTLTTERLREFGVLKAIGAENNQLYKIVLNQALIVAMTGFFIGVILLEISSAAISMFMPELMIYVTFETLFYTLIASVLMGLASSYLPIKRIAGVDPAIVFKS